MELSLVGMSDAGEIERAVTAFARAANGGVIVTGSTPAIVHRELITTWQRGTGCLRSMHSATSSPLAA
jgi:hypothetical protein